MSAETLDHSALMEMGALQRRRLVMWVMLSVLAALLAYFGFHGYLTPELLAHVGNSLCC
jgi:hypothetical protein